MTKKKILEVVGGEFTASGSSVMVWRWYENWDLTNLNIDFLCMNPPEENFVQSIKKNGGKCYVRKNHRSKILKTIMTARFLRKIVYKDHYKCIHVHISNALIVLIIYLICRTYVEEILVHSHNTNIGSSHLKKAIHSFCKQLLPCSKITWIACSDDAAKWLFPLKVVKNRQYSVIRYGIDPQKYVYNYSVREHIRKEHNLGNRFVVGHIGRFVYQKNHTFLIDIFQKVCQKCPEATLLLIGDKDAQEDLMPDIRNKVAALNLTDSVIFYGNTAKVNELYQAMDCFVLPSRYEGLGIVLIEAQAAGLKTLCSDTVPKEAKVTDLIKYMSLKSSPEKWAEEILSYNDHYKRKNTSQQIESAEYAISSSAKKIESLYL